MIQCLCFLFFVVFFMQGVLQSRSEESLKLVQRAKQLLQKFPKEVHNFTLSSLQTNTDTFANSADPDEMVSSGSTVCHFVIDFFTLTPATMNASKIRHGRIHVRNLIVNVCAFYFSTSR